MDIKCHKCGKKITDGVDWWVTVHIPINVEGRISDIFENWCWDCHKREEAKEWERRNI